MGHNLETTFQVTLLTFSVQYNDNARLAQYSIIIRSKVMLYCIDGQFHRDSRYTFENFTTYILLVK